MKHLRLILVAIIATFCLVGTATAATVPVTNLHDQFHATNSTVTLTTDGVHFGTYANGGALGGTLITHDYDGLVLSDISDLSYTFNYRVGDQPAGYTAAPYLRIFLDTNDDGNVDTDVLLDPGYCTTEDVPQSTDLTYQMVGNDRLRYDDDGCDSLASVDTWDNIVEAHGGETIVGILVTQGNSVGTDVSAMLGQMTINGDTFVFGAPEAGPVGPQGAPGSNGTNGTNGSNGAAGAQGQPGVAGPAGPAGPSGRNGTNGVNGTNGSNGSDGANSCRGAGTRTLHVQTIKGSRFVSATATLRGKKLKVNGRTITVVLPATEGNYNIRITAKFSKAGKTRTVKTTRNLSVACK
jgi:hypothetical protein